MDLLQIDQIRQGSILSEYGVPGGTCRELEGARRPCRRTASAPPAAIPRPSAFVCAPYGNTGHGPGAGEGRREHIRVGPAEGRTAVTRRCGAAPAAEPRRRPRGPRARSDRGAGAVAPHTLPGRRRAAVPDATRTPSAGDGGGFLVVKGCRDLAMGLGTGILLVTGQRRALGWVLLMTAVAPLGDMVNVAAHHGSTATTFGVHGLTSALIAATGLLLLRETDKAHEVQQVAGPASAAQPA
ncbi:DUF4267 domain-containing protein [Nocardia sp. NPDC052254]|uniref:DUF4267 domain-containing protein n=1 Tax=Nocardia sp. NPDC052254 TaxID=3155681 RepID=UPI0034171C46